MHRYTFRASVVHFPACQKLIRRRLVDTGVAKPGVSPQFAGLAPKKPWP